MAVALDLLSSNIREDLRTALRQALESKLYAKTVSRTVATEEPDPGDDPREWAEVPVIARREWTQVLYEVFGENLPAPDERTAEVKTPAEILVWAFCPRCKMPAAIRVFISPVLTIDSTGSSLKLKASSKATYHVCGQQTLPRPADVADGQQELLPDDEDEADPDDDEPAADANDVDLGEGAPNVEVEEAEEAEEVEPPTPQEAVKFCDAIVDGQACGLHDGHAGDHDPDALPF